MRRAGQSWVWSIDSLHHPRLMRQSRYITHATCGLARSITHVFCGLARSITHALFVLSPTPPQKIINVFNGLKWFSTAVTRARVSLTLLFLTPEGSGLRRGHPCGVPPIKSAPPPLVKAGRWPEGWVPKARHLPRVLDRRSGRHGLGVQASKLAQMAASGHP